MKKIILGLALIILVGCQNTGDEIVETPPVVTDTPLTQTAPPINKVEKIVLEEWFDYGCHYCEQAHSTVKNLKKKYGDKLEIVEKHFPLSARTMVFAEASECARDQGMFNEFHDEVFTYYYGKYDVSNLKKIAEAIKIPDLDQFNTCVASGVNKGRVTTDTREAEKLGVSGTPFFRINKELNIPGAISQQSFEGLFDQLLSES